MYEQAQAAGAGAQAGPDMAGNGGASQTADDDIIDGDFREV